MRWRNGTYCALLVLACCAESVPIAFKYARSEPPVAPEVYEHELQNIFGLQFEQRRWGYGVINVEIVDTGDRTAGLHVPMGPCRQYNRATPRLAVVAHEVGHALGLDHVDDRYNLMHPSGSDTLELEQWQLEQAYDGASLLAACIP